MSHLWFSTVAGPTARRDNVLRPIYVCNGCVGDGIVTMVSPTLICQRDGSVEVQCEDFGPTPGRILGAEFER